MAFQVVEFELDAQGNVLERRVVPYPYQGRQEAAAAAKSIAGRYAEARYDQTNNFWCAVIRCASPSKKSGTARSLDGYPRVCTK